MKNAFITSFVLGLLIVGYYVAQPAFEARERAEALAITVDASSSPQELMAAIATANLPTRLRAVRQLGLLEPMEEPHIDALVSAARSADPTLSAFAVDVLLARQPEALPRVVQPVARALGEAEKAADTDMLPFAGIPANNFDDMGEGMAEELTSVMFISASIKQSLYKLPPEQVFKVLPAFGEIVGGSDVHVSYGAGMAIRYLTDTLEPRHGERLIEIANQIQSVEGRETLMHPARILNQAAESD